MTNDEISRAIRHVLARNVIGPSIHILDLTAAVKWLLPDQHVEPDTIIQIAEIMLLEDRIVQPFAIVME